MSNSRDDDKVKERVANINELINSQDNDDLNNFLRNIGLSNEKSIHDAIESPDLKSDKIKMIDEKIKKLKEDIVLANHTGLNAKPLIKKYQQSIKVLENLKGVLQVKQKVSWKKTNAKKYRSIRDSEVGEGVKDIGRFGAFVGEKIRSGATSVKDKITSKFTSPKKNR